MCRDIPLYCQSSSYIYLKYKINLNDHENVFLTKDVNRHHFSGLRPTKLIYALLSGSFVGQNGGFAKNVFFFVILYK